MAYDPYRDRFAPVAKATTGSASKADPRTPYFVEKNYGGEIKPRGGNSAMAAAGGAFEVLEIVAEAMDAHRQGEENIRNFNDPRNSSVRRHSDVAWQLPMGKEFTLVITGAGTESEVVEYRAGWQDTLHAPDTIVVPIIGTNTDPR